MRGKELAMKKSGGRTIHDQKNLRSEKFTTERFAEKIVIRKIRDAKYSLGPEFQVRKIRGAKNCDKNHLQDEGLAMRKKLIVTNSR